MVMAQGQRALRALGREQTSRALHSVFCSRASYAGTECNTLDKPHALLGLPLLEIHPVLIE